MATTVAEHEGARTQKTIGLDGVVAAAGELTVIDGKLASISNESGHYEPNGSYTEQALTTLKAQGLEISGVEVRDISNGTSHVVP